MWATGYPAWVALSTSGLGTLDLPGAAHKVIVLADGGDLDDAAVAGHAPRDGCGRDGVCASSDLRAVWISTICYSAARPTLRGAQ